MTREELIRDAKEARELGDSDLELAILEKIDTLPDESVSEDQSNPVMNVIRGFAGRGNQAIGALNPWADKEKLAMEKEWMKQHPESTFGSIIADMMITAPAGGLGSLGARAFGTGAIEGLTRDGSYSDRMHAAEGGAIGSVIGEGAGKALTFLAQPFKKTTNAAKLALIEKAKRAGIPLNAAQMTGDKSLQYADSALDFIPSTSKGQQAFKDTQRKKWTEALFNEGDEAASSASQETMGRMKDRISSVYDDVSSRNALTVDQTLVDDLNKIRTDFSQIIPVNQKAIVKKYLSDFAGPPIGADISGKNYQSIRSMLDKQAKGFRNSDPATHDALTGIRKAIDEAMERSLQNPSRIGGNPNDLAAWKKANKDWMVMKHIEKGTDPLTDEVSPAKLLSEMTRRDPNRVIYGKGDQNLTDIAKIGKEFISSKTADSGTAQRAAMIKGLTGGGMIGTTAATAAYNPSLAAGLLAGEVAGGILLPKMAASMMRNPDGYLVNGLVDLAKESLPGFTRKQIIEELMRNMGVQGVNEVTQ